MHTHKFGILITSVLSLLLLTMLPACSPGHLGGNEIAFLRNGQLWTIDQDGANAFTVVNYSLPVISYSWSPSHHILVYRSLDADFAKTAPGQHIALNPLTTEPGDLPSTINTISIDGGTAIPTMFSSPTLRYSSPIWIASGTHLLFRQEEMTDVSPDTALWFVAQDDQPGGIAATTLPHSYSIPSISDNTNMAIGNSPQGVFSTTLAGTSLHYLIHGQLPGHPLPATLERILWQPGHQNPALLYAILAATPAQPTTTASPLMQLLLRESNGSIRSLTICHCTQFAWSPDGNNILYTTGTAYTVLNLTNMTSFTVRGEAQSVPYWSPDSALLLLDGLHTLSLVSLRTKQLTILLSDTTSPTQSNVPPLPAFNGGTSVNALLHPIPNSIWAADSSHFLFLMRGRTLWQGHALSSGRGIYTVTLGRQGQVQGQPTLVDAGNDTQPGWSYEDANTSFLFP
jgi:hypothetical protein